MVKGFLEMSRHFYMTSALVRLCCNEGGERPLPSQGNGACCRDILLHGVEEPRSSRVLFSRSGGHKTKETYHTRPGTPLHVNRVLLSKSLMEMIHSSVNSQEPIPILYKEKGFQFIKLKSV